MSSHPTPATTIDACSSVPCSAPIVPTTDTAKEWHAHYAKWISRFWKRIRQEAKDLGIIPKSYRGLVHAKTISSNDISDPAVALCHYLVETNQHVSAQFNHGVAEWSYLELGLADRAAADAGGATEVVLRAWLQGPDKEVRKAKGNWQWDYGCAVPPVPGYWRALRGVGVVGVPEAVECREMEEEQMQWEDEEVWREEEQVRRAGRKRDREAVAERLELDVGRRTVSEERRYQEESRRLKAEKDMKKREQRDWYAEASRRRREREESPDDEVEDTELKSEVAELKAVREVPDCDEEETAGTEISMEVPDS